MTPQELATLPKGTRVRFDLAPIVDPDPPDIEGPEIDTDYGYDLGTIVQPGAQCGIQWDPKAYQGGDFGYGPTSLIDTLSKSWTRFIQDISLDTPPESV